MKNFYIVHCIDTEGPLQETVEATFERLKHIYHLDFKPSNELLKKLQNAEVDLNGLEKSVQNTLDPRLLDYNDNWTKIYNMLHECLDSNFRNNFKDSFDNGWVYNWHCVDHVDYDYNPRNRDLGYNKIFDYYQSILKEKKCNKDGMYFHYHPHPIKKFAHLSATRWIGPTDKLFQILCRRIIDRSWFPASNRPGFQVTRPDSHWFLEQYIPFDFASLASEPESNDYKQFDISNGRSGDWRRAPITWEPYHPHHDDYQLRGNCNRWIARSLNIGTRFANLNDLEVERAFLETLEGKSVVLSFSNHDFRDLRKDVSTAYHLIKKKSEKYPGINFINSTCVEAMRKSLKLLYVDKAEFEIEIKEIKDSVHILKIKSSQKIFGSQPFLAIKTLNGEYIHDNFDFQIPFREWSYTFDAETLFLKEIDTIGIAANNSYGITSILNFNVKKKEILITYLNQ
jgi:hypothetical protein